MKFASKYQSVLLVAITCLTFVTNAAAQESKSAGSMQTDTVVITETANSFLIAFKNLDWDRFADYFADDVTVFFPPSAKYPYRANDKAETLKIFKTVFENARKRRQQAPYLDIDPKDVKLQLFGQIAIETFTLDDPNLLSRRTIIWEKKGNTWRIIHLHASGIPVDVN